VSVTEEHKNMKIVVALGGNAISREDQKGDIPDQINNCHVTAKYIVDLVAAGHKVVTTHGNGPQVGNILRRVEAARGIVYPLPLDICGAHSQGGIGYILQREIDNTFKQRGIDKVAYAVVTQCLVDRKDPAFQKPTKPVGPFFTKEKIQPMVDHDGWTVVEDAGRGYRRVVPSPIPTKIIEERIIRQVVDFGDVVVCCGGGGIPVVDENGMLVGVEGVIDKDFATSLLARKIQADLMIITTGVKKVAVQFKKPGQKFFDRMTVAEAKKYYEAGEFPPGSMGPKILAAIEFIEETGKEVIITLPEMMMEAVQGKTGTRIVK
jgi:carbamate kinase